MDKSGSGPNADADRCYICLGPLGGETVASLDNCQHVFCLQCILQWSQTANTCPVDRISFAFIHPGGDVRKKIKVRMHKKEDDDDEEEGRSDIFCEECGRGDRRPHLLVCIHCDSGYHTDCLPPSSVTSPEGDWICPECVLTHPHTDADRTPVEEEISEGELTDLLAEVEASTSSRLRPSTINQPSSSAERRHSERIQNRAVGNPSPRPETSWHVPKYLIRALRSAVPAEESVAAKHDSDTRNFSGKANTRRRKK